MTLHWPTIAYLNVVSIFMAKEHLDLFDGMPLSIAFVASVLLNL